MYDASGVKLRKIVQSYNNATLTSEKIFDYINGVEYEGTNLTRLANTEGAVVKNANGGYEYEYVLRDHLGNTRATFRDSNNDGIVTPSDICQVNHYYPFGLNMEGNWSPSGCGLGNKYQYNGKELNSDFGLEWNDYGARFYDAAIGRFPTVDPMAEKFINITPYAYVMNRPLTMIDPSGMEAIFNAKTGELEKATGKDAQNYVRGLQKAASKAEKKESGKKESEKKESAEGNPVSGASSTGGENANSAVEGGGGCGGAGQPPCPPGTDANSLDPGTLNKNIFGSSYPGPNNPQKYNGSPDYTFSPGFKNYSEYPAIGHDRAYDMLQIKGGGGLFFSMKAIHADWRFVRQELSYAFLDPFPNNSLDKVKAGILGIGLGSAALLKTVLAYSNPYTAKYVNFWGTISTTLTNNSPSR